MVRLFMIQRYITFLEKTNFLHTILYTFLLIFINVLHKLLKYNKLAYMILKKTCKNGQIFPNLKC